MLKNKNDSVSNSQAQKNYTEKLRKYLKLQDKNIYTCKIVQMALSIIWTFLTLAIELKY